MAVTVEGKYGVYEYPSGTGWSLNDAGHLSVTAEGRSELGTHAVFDCVFDPAEVKARERDAE